ncbi:MAG: YlcI/YnfO family protein [Chroococcales cyanobacterium]
MEGSVSLHIPQELLESAQRLSSPDETLNDVVILALDREVRRRKGLAAHQKIIALNKELPPQPDDTELIRQLREREGQDD